jgi:CheY-like chemotaxis protein
MSIDPIMDNGVQAGGSDDMSLWIAKGIIEEHGGTVHMYTDSRHRRKSVDTSNFAATSGSFGCHFVVEIPLVPSADDSGTGTHAPQPPPKKRLSTAFAFSSFSENENQPSLEALMAATAAAKASTQQGGGAVATSPPMLPTITRGRSSVGGGSAKIHVSVPDTPLSREVSPAVTPTNAAAAKAGRADASPSWYSASKKDASTAAPPDEMPINAEATTGSDHASPPAPAVVRKELLLVVDDSDLTRKMLCRIMKAQGYDCEEAEDGAEAVHKVRERHAAGLAAYDGILMDFVMYVRRGFFLLPPVRIANAFGPATGIAGL